MFTPFYVTASYYSRTQSKHTPTVYGPKKIYFTATSGDTYGGTVGAEEFLISKHVQTSPEAHTAFTLMGTGISSRGQGGRRVMLTPQRHPAPGLKMSRTIPLLPICDFVTCVGQLYPYIYIYIYRERERERETERESSRIL